MIKKYIPWTIRIFIFLLFLVSGVAKMFPVWTFEKQLVDLGITTWCIAPYFARLLIALEIALGIAILQRHYIKKIVITSAILLLISFSIHLVIEMYKHGAMNGNCGCFGQLIDMTPLAAFIKNVIMIGFLLYLYRHVTGNETAENKFIYLLLICLSSLLFMFIFFPFSPCQKKVNSERTVIHSDSIQDKVPTAVLHVGTSENAAVRDINQSRHVLSEPAKVDSKFSEYTTFGSKRVRLDEGKKIICLFAPGCDHCREAAKAICKLLKKDNFPEVYILFMNEETDLIADFFKEVQCEFPYQVIDILKFWQLLGDATNTPGVFFLWNGNIMKFYEGVGNNKFSPEGLKKASESKYK
jgi:thiol-disulfide isomerase/thioredoxin